MDRKIKHLSLFFLLLVLNSAVIFAQSINHSQSLSDLIPTKKWFEIENYYQQHKNSINSEFVELWYLAETGSVFNRPFESIDAYEQLIQKNLLNMDMPTLIALFGQPLLQLCADVQEYAKAENLCQKLITQIEKDTIVDANMRLSYIHGFTQAIESFKQFAKIYPKLTVTNKNDKTSEVELTPNDFSNGIFLMQFGMVIS